jgi:transposase InsO family protein
MASDYTLKDLCAALRVPRSAYYAWRRRIPGPRERENQLLRRTLSALFAANRQVYGSPRLTVCLQRQGFACSRNRVARHMRALDLKARQKRAFRPKTTDASHPHPIAPNRLAQRPEPKAPDRVWVTDITYVFTVQGWLYLAAVMDLYSRKIVGWATATHLKTSLPQAALEQAIGNRSPGAGLLHHSDRGCQYASKEYRTALASLKALPSMSAQGNCYDNAAMESFWSSLKTEWLHRHHFQNQHQAQLAIFDYIETFYNPKRLHSALGYLSPVDYEQTNHHAH